MESEVMSRRVRSLRSLSTCSVVSLQTTSVPCGTPKFVADGTVTIGPVNFFQFSVAVDGDELIEIPGGFAAGHYRFDLRADDGPLSPANIRRRVGRERWDVCRRECWGDNHRCKTE